jgi:DNA-binding FadR family transcriptional regulator
MVRQPAVDAGVNVRRRRSEPLLDAPEAQHVVELFAPLRFKNAGEQVAERLVTALALGVFVPGQRLPTERDLAGTLGVSRTTIREAVSRLAATGYVEVRRGRHGGAFVIAELGPDTDEMVRRTLVRDWDRFEQLFDFRVLVEPMIAATAARRRTPEDIDRIAAALELPRGRLESRGVERGRPGAAPRNRHGRPQHVPR